MSLDLSELRRKARAGNLQAKAVLPLRRNSHLSLAAILLGNVGMISATSLVMGDRFGGLIAGVVSTLMLVIFGEILPQAVFLKSALPVTAFFAPFTKLLIFVTFPVSKPLQLLLDKLFGRHRPHLHTRQELGMIIGEHVDSNQSELDDNEVEIIQGALQLSEKRVRDIYTPIKKVYWFTPDTVIDGKKIDEIKANSWSRIPVLSKDKTKCHGTLLMKSLVDMDFDEQPKLVSELKVIPLPSVGSMTVLDTMFRRFINAHTHLMAVEKDSRIIGIVTIEDLLEEIIGQEIEDETDDQRLTRKNLMS